MDPSRGERGGGDRGVYTFPGLETLLFSLHVSPCSVEGEVIKESCRIEEFSEPGGLSFSIVNRGSSLELLLRSCVLVIPRVFR